VSASVSQLRAGCQGWYRWPRWLVRAGCAESRGGGVLGVAAELGDALSRGKDPRSGKPDRAAPMPATTSGTQRGVVFTSSIWWSVLSTHGKLRSVRLHSVVKAPTAKPRPHPPVKAAQHDRHCMPRIPAGLAGRAPTLPAGRDLSVRLTGHASGAGRCRLPRRPIVGLAAAASRALPAVASHAVGFADLRPAAARQVPAPVEEDGGR
jgi:hypothetical protein